MLELGELDRRCCSRVRNTAAEFKPWAVSAGLWNCAQRAAARRGHKLEEVLRVVHAAVARLISRFARASDCE